MLAYPLPELSRPLPWQQTAWSTLQHAAQSGRLAHALLLTGAPGTGRNAFAAALARQLLCAEPLPEGNCGHCKTCELSRRGAHADFLLLQSEEAGKAIGIDAVRRALRFATSTSSLGRHKVILVSPLEALTANAFNAFLKGLEEPADDTHFILVHGRGHRVPATVRSRCQTRELPLPARAEARAWLAAALKAEGAPADDAVDTLLELAEGRPLEALQLASGDALAPLQALRGALDTAARDGDPAPLLMAAAKLPPELLLEQMARHLRGALRGAAVAGARDGMRTGLRELDTLERLRTVLASGSNPNADLLRFAAADAFADACNALRPGAKLAATRR